MVAQIAVVDPVHAVRLVQSGRQLGQEAVRRDTDVALHPAADVELEPQLDLAADFLELRVLMCSRVPWKSMMPSSIDFICTSANNPA
jgi:hypothetical protein